MSGLVATSEVARTRRRREGGRAGALSRRFAQQPCLAIQPDQVSVMARSSSMKSPLVRERMSENAEGTPEDDTVREPTEITYAEHFHPARPRTLRFRPRVKAPFARQSLAEDGP